MLPIIRRIFVCATVSRFPEVTAELWFISKARPRPAPSGLHAVGCRQQVEIEDIGINVDLPSRADTTAGILTGIEGTPFNAVIMVTGANAIPWDVQLFHPDGRVLIARRGTPLGESPGVHCRIVRLGPPGWRVPITAGERGRNLAARVRGAGLMMREKRRSIELGQVDPLGSKVENEWHVGESRCQATDLRRLNR
jgi:hypothetical protein